MATSPQSVHVTGSGIAWSLFLCAGLATVGCREVTEGDPSVLLQQSLSQPVAIENAAASYDWPGWRGGTAHGVAESLPASFRLPEDQRWSVPVPGQGKASPVIADGRVFLPAVTAAADGSERMVLFCYDLDSGTLLWRRMLGSVVAGATHQKNGYASGTAVVGQGRVFVAFGAHGLFAVDLEGRRLWSAPLPGWSHAWGTASSPVFYQGLVIVVCDSQHGDSRLVAFDAESGQVRWSRRRNSSGCWSTPAIVVGAGPSERPELIVNGTGTEDGSPGVVIAYDPRSGKELWQVPGTSDIPCPTAIVGEGLVVSSSGANGPLIAMRPGLAPAQPRERVAWRTASGGPQVPTGVCYRGLLFLVNDRGLLTCRSLVDGKLRWRQRLRGSYSASLLAGNGVVMALSEQGELQVVAAEASGFQLLGEYPLGTACHATPAVAADGRLVIRTAERLLCVASPPPTTQLTAGELTAGDVDVPAIASGESLRAVSTEPPLQAAEPAADGGVPRDHSLPLWTGEQRGAACDDEPAAAPARESAAAPEK